MIEKMITTAQLLDNLGMYQESDDLMEIAVSVSFGEDPQFQAPKESNEFQAFKSYLAMSSGCGCNKDENKLREWRNQIGERQFLQWMRCYEQGRMSANKGLLLQKEAEEFSEIHQGPQAFELGYNSVAVN